MGPPSNMRSVVDRNVVMWRMTVLQRNTPRFNGRIYSVFRHTQHKLPR